MNVITSNGAGPDAKHLGIADVSYLTGMSQDTLRWYEKEGVIPPVPRGDDRRRLYGPASLRFIRLIQALRRTGMPVADVKAFVNIGPGTTMTHPLRLELLESQLAAIDQQREQLETDRRTVSEKIADYKNLIRHGLDCEDLD